ncbi:MAG TPA: PQQ-dependent sugar dehydrogenase [Ignavibacteriales bacterium]|nr:PQQ-dependent sugar dehydrogenase [Ignavibacteriales bacterium]
MKTSSVLLLSLLSAQFLACPNVKNSESPENPSGQINIVNAFPNLTFENIVGLEDPRDGTNRLFAVSQNGAIRVFENTPEASSSIVFLDIQSKVVYGGEQGLLGLAFHPDYEKNGYFYVNYTAPDPRRTVIERYSVKKNDPNSADPQSGVIILEIEQPYSNHNGGQLSFGPDGYLYTILGDGGSGGDPLNSGQDRKSLLGKLLRINVNQSSGNKHYSIPSDNPYKGNMEGFKEEIYAYGLRNMWRFSWDAETKKLWCADVGQDKWEEINIIEAGKNYGWRVMEGTHCYDPAEGCDKSAYTLPIWEYGHDENGGYSITGGFVYRGKSIKELTGKYIYADYVSRNIWALAYDGKKASSELLLKGNISISSFGIDKDNELYLCSHHDGKIFKFSAK